jgi:Nif-specific regulatory protein
VLGKPPLITERDLLLQSTNHTEAAQSFNFDLQDKTLKTVMNECKKNYIIKILEEVQWNQTEAAKVLDVQRTYVSKLIKDLQIKL